MELDQLKEIWNDANQSSSTISEEGLHQMLTQRSRRPIAIMKRNLKLEVFFLILIYSIFIWQISIKGSKEYLYYDLVLVVVAILFFIYARYKYRLLNDMECIGCEVKANLNLQIQSLEKLIKLYFQIANFGVILVYVFAGTVSYIQNKDGSVYLPQAVEIIIFLLIGGVLMVINYYIGRWYLFSLYGKHIIKLKNILYEMDESDPK